MALTNEIKDKIVLALTGTTREQCSYRLADGEARCALGVIAESIGVDSCAEVLSFVDDLELSCRIAAKNDSGSTFDEIAKLVKEWPVDGDQ